MTHVFRRGQQTSTRVEELGQPEFKSLGKQGASSPGSSRSDSLGISRLSEQPIPDQGIL